MKKALIIAVYVFIFWIILPTLLVGGAQLLDTQLFPEALHSNMLVFIGVMLIFVSCPLLIITIIQFRKFGNELPISATPPERIIRKGLFSVWRHPIYLFYVMLFIGITMVTGSKSGLYFVIPLFVFIVAFYILFEERTLIRRFGESYKNHLRQTPLLIPRFNKIIKTIARFLIKSLFLYKASGLENIPHSPPFIMICSHRNYLDPFFVGISIPFNISYVTTYEMFRNPLTNFFFRKLYCIPKRRYLNDYSTAKMIISTLKKDFVIGIFPEGERSWTGEMNSFKKEALNLFQKLHRVPILPVKLEGNYFAWPRWGKKPRKSKVEVTFQSSFYVDPGKNVQELELQLRTLLQPADAAINGFGCFTENRVANLPVFLYRCPQCKTFDSFIVTGKSTFKCARCGVSFKLDSRYNIFNQTSESMNPETIGTFYRKTKVTVNDIVPTTDCVLMERPKFPKDEDKIACSLRVQLFLEKKKQFEQVCAGPMFLTSGHLIFPLEDKQFILKLERIGAVTLESNYKLQLYEKYARELYQVVFSNESAKKWQDFIVETMKKNQISIPVTR